jgi:wyosine [tRNA(Phe)-imidazoG37] synthetase (radical SAM superfamily)
MGQGALRYVYGPVPSRRLGRSLGIDLVPYKTCTYDCIYCHVGRTTNRTVERREYIPIGEVLTELRGALDAGAAPDYIGIAGSGEPTLNSGLGELIRKIKGMTSIPVAVFTNGSLLGMRDVRQELSAADLVLPSLDAGDAFLFQYVNRPHGDLSFEAMVDGLVAFTEGFAGEVWLEVVLLGGVTGMSGEVEKIAAIVRRIRPARVQLNTAVRPPAEDFALPLSAVDLSAFKGLFPGAVDIIGENGPVGPPVRIVSEISDADVMALLRRRPCTVADVSGGLGIHPGEAIKHLDRLRIAGRVGTYVNGGERFFKSRECEPERIAESGSVPASGLRISMQS